MKITLKRKQGITTINIDSNETIMGRSGARLITHLTSGIISCHDHIILPIGAKIKIGEINKLTAKSIMQGMATKALYAGLKTQLL